MFNIIPFILRIYNMFNIKIKEVFTFIIVYVIITIYG